MIQADVHMHTNFSHDSESSPEQMVEGAIAKGLKVLCFTDHYYKDNTDWGQEDIFDPETYFLKMQEVREKYKEKIDIRIGVEIGLQPYLGDYYKEFVKKYPFDFVIGSSHVVHGLDPYYAAFYEKRTEKAAYREYFESILENIESYHDFDVYGHLDYVVRYGPTSNENYDWIEYQDVIDEILRKLVFLGKGIELNTGGFKYGLGHPNPTEEIIRRYRELGGEMITIGADAHKPEHVAFDFAKVPSILKDAGFDYFTVFRERKPEFVRIE